MAGKTRTAAPGMCCCRVNWRNFREDLVCRTSSRKRQLIPLLRKNLMMESSFSEPVVALERLDPMFHEPNLKLEGREMGWITHECFRGRMGARESSLRLIGRVSMAR